MSPAATASDAALASAIEVVWDRRDEWDRRLTMIAQARSFLYQSLFYLEYDDYGRRMVAALTEAQRRGVRVQLVIDTFGQRLGGVLMTAATRRALTRDLHTLRASGGQVIWYTPPRLLQRVMGGGHHFKIQVSEAGELLLSSGNVTKSSFDGWNECSLSIRGSVAVDILAALPAIGGRVHAADLDVLRQNASPGTIPVEFWFSNPNDVQSVGGFYGSRWRNDVTDRMVAMVNAAERSLAITSFYFKPTEPLMSAVIAAARRGVRVEVFHSHVEALPATDLAWIAAAASYPRLLDAGVTIHENRRGEHSKIVLVDDEWVACGSYNFEDAAHDRLAEAMLATRHAPVVAEFRRIVQGLREDSDTSQVTQASWNNLPDRLRRRVARFGRFKRYL